MYFITGEEYNIEISGTLQSQSLRTVRVYEGRVYNGSEWPVEPGAFSEGGCDRKVGDG